MKNAFAIVTLSAALAASAHGQTTPDDEGAGSALPPIKPDAQENLPKLDLSADLLYRIMKAELLAKEGQWQEAFSGFSSLAQETRDPRLAKRAAEVALGAKQQEATLAAIRQWRQLAPDSEEAAQYFLGFVILTDRLDEAERILSARLAEVSATARGAAIFQVQQFLSRAPNKASAQALVIKLLEPYANLLETHVVLAQVALARGDGVLARKEAEIGLALKPDSELGVLMLAQVVGEDAPVEALLGKFLLAHPDAREVRMAYARVLANQKQFDRARAEFIALLKAQPDNLMTLYAVGLMSLQLNDAAGAEQHLKRFMEVFNARPNEERDPTKVLLMLAQLAEERGDLPGALSWLGQVEANDGRAYFGAQLKRAQLTGKQGDLPAARAMLSELSPEGPPEQVQLATTEAQILRDAGQAEAAFGVLDNAVVRHPTNPDLLYDFALLAEKTGRMDIMERALRSVIEQAPENHHAYNALGYSLAERNIRLPEALELIDKALKMAPGDPFIMDSMGWVHYRLGDLNKAEDMLRRAYSLRSDPEIAVHLGEVLWKKGQRMAAQQLWKEARAKDPQNDTLKATLARLNQSL